VPLWLIFIFVPSVVSRMERKMHGCMTADHAGALDLNFTIEQRKSPAPRFEAREHPEMPEDQDMNPYLPGTADRVSAAPATDSMRIRQLEIRLKGLERENELLLLQLHEALEVLEAYRFRSRSLVWRLTDAMSHRLSMLRKLLIRCARFGYRQLIR
jgi:hypothetical protein